MSEGQDLAREKRLFELIHEVADLTGHEREAVLANCQLELASEVRSRLAAVADRGDSFLSPVPLGRLGIDQSLPESIGPYQPVELLGEGGMGRVYLAEQQQPVERRVALKVLRFSTLGREARARFEAERHAMGRLDHPNIGKILEAGTTAEGLPFFAMELIDGSPITTYCDDRRLSIEDRLRLFIDVCRGVDHAHHKLLLHRDIKPSNILVSEVDGRPVPRLIDFGIAKGLDRSLIGGTLATGERLIGTLGYMSPETLGPGGDVDTRSDVFSLGVVLYELLTGQRPWLEDDGTPLGLLKRQTEGESVRPSTRMTSLEPADRSAAARHRREQPSDFARRLRGDLDWITLKAIAHRPVERYTSAADLAEDIEHYLADEPVSARKPTTTYLLRKLVRRHRGRVIAAALLAIALVFGAVGTTVGLVRARAEAARANREAEAAREARDRAVEARRTSDQLSGSLVELFESIDTNDRRSANLTPHELLLRGVEAVESRLSDQPQARGVLLATIGDILTGWDDFPAGDSLLREAVRVLGAPGQEPGAPLVRALRKLVYVATQLGRPRQALEFAERAQRVQDELGEAADPYLSARILVSGGGALRALGRLKEADMWLRRGIELHRRIDSSAETIGIAYIEVGRVARMRKDWSGMIAHNQVAIELFEPRADTNFNRLSVAWGNVGIALIELQRLREAEAAIALARELPEKALGSDAPRLLGVLYLEGVLRHCQGEAAKSEAALRRYLELQRQRRPAADPVLAEGLSSLGWTIWSAGGRRNDEAVTLLTEAMKIFRQAADPRYLSHVEALFRLGQIHQTEGRSGLAETHYREALELIENFEEAPAIDRAEGHRGLGRSLLGQQRFDEARAALGRAQKLFEVAGDADGLAETRTDIEALRSRTSGVNRR